MSDAPPGFDNQTWNIGYQGKGNLYSPYPGKHGQVSLADLMHEVRLGNQRSDSNFYALQMQFNQMQQQFATLQLELTQLKAEMVTRSEFETLREKVDQLNIGSGTAEMKNLYFHLNRLDPANKCLAIGHHLSAQVALVTSIRHFESSDFFANVLLQALTF